jgi:galactokinase
LLAAGERVTDAVLARRARHLQTENQRVRAMAEALATGDAKAAGALLTEGHRSLRDDLENTTGTIDDLVDRLAATPGVHGARLTGGGWGGMVVALAAPGALAGTGLEVAASGGATVEIATSA